MGANGYPVTLEQLGGSRLTLDLEGMAAPTDGAPDAGKQRITREWLPGSNEPNDQQLGVEWEPMRLRGYFHDGDMGATGAALDAVRKLRVMGLEGHRVRITWGDVWQREGLIHRWNTPRYDDGLSEWSLEFWPQTVEDAPKVQVTAQRQVSETQLAAASAVLRALDDTRRGVQRAAAASAWVRLIT